MFRTITTGLVAILVLGSTSLVRADSGLDAFQDTSHSGAAYQQVLTTKPVALPKAAPKADNGWMNQPSQNFGGGM